MQEIVHSDPGKSGVVSAYNKPSIIERIFAQFFSVVFHPLFIPIYVVLFLAYIHPSAFTGFSAKEKSTTVFIVALNIVLFPLLSVFLLRMLGFIESIFLHTKKDRIIPYMACGIFFFWAYTVFKQQPQYPLLLTAFVLGIFLASSAGLIANIYFKISMHAIGMGGLIGFCLVVYRTGSMHMSWPLAMAVLIAGIVCTSRLMISDHTSKHIYIGLVAGFLSQIIAALFVM